MPSEIADAAASSGATQTITIQGLMIAVPAPYNEGDTLNKIEASVLNQTFAENVRNNCAKIVKNAKEAAERAENPVPFDEGSVKDAILSYANEYEFGERKSVGVVVDPVVREATKIAKEHIRAKLKAKNVSLKDLAEGELDRLASELIEKRPEIKQEAERRIAALASLAEAEVGE